MPSNMKTTLLEGYIQRLPSFLLVGIKKQRIEKSKEDHMA